MAYPELYDSYPVTRSSSVTQILADAQLEPEIRFPHPISPRALHPREIFLTGATGLVASWLLDDLMRTTDTVVHCLVRGANQPEAEARLRNHLRRCGLCQGDFLDRIHVIRGDISEPRFGLTEHAFAELASRTDAIHHCAGWLNMAYPYSRLKATNVTGTREVLRLAGLEGTRPVHYLSSMVVFFSDAHPSGARLLESDVPLYHDTLRGGYSKSKWVADRLMAQAQERGLPACIHRPVRIMGHSQTGAIDDLNDVLPVLLKGCILLGSYPRFDIEVTMVPVDYVTGAIRHLSQQTSAWGKAYHFFHPAPIHWMRLMGMIRELGYSLEAVPYEQWWKELKQAIRNAGGETKKFLSGVLLSMTAPHFLFYNRPPLDAAQLSRQLEGSGVSCPPIDRELIGVYLAHWRQNGFIPAPEEVGDSLATKPC